MNSTEYYNDMVNTYSEYITEDRMHELHYLTDAQFDKLVFSGNNTNVPINLLNIFTKKELSYILDYSELLSTYNRDWVTNYVLDEFFKEEQ